MNNHIDHITSIDDIIHNTTASILFIKKCSPVSLHIGLNTENM